jgi:hypothetical protein
MKKSLVIASIIGLAAIATPQSAHLLRIKAKTGQSFKYAMDIQSGASMKMGMTMNMKIAKATANEITVNSTMGNMVMNGQPAPAAAADMIKKMLVVTVMDPRGRILKTETKGIPGMTGAANQGSSVPFPQAAVRIGGTWSGEANIQGQKVKTNYKLIAVKPVMGKQAAVIHATPIGMTSFKPNGPIVFSIELATGFPLSMDMTGTATQGTSTQQVKMTMRRV